MDILHVHGASAGSAWAIGVAALVLIVSGGPLAGVALTLSAWTTRAGHQWRPGWRPMFQAGFVVQVCSLFIVLPLSLVFLLSSVMGPSTSAEQVVALVGGLNVVVGAFALRAWRRLMGSTIVEAPPSILRSSA
jgi:hypothetical protein